jgi:glycosyltransferase involved in cell wall biosynthesis
VPVENARHAGGRVAFENLRKLRDVHRHVDAVVCTSEHESVVPAPPDITVYRQTAGQLGAYLVTHARSLGWRRVVSAHVLHTRLQLQAQHEIERLMRQQEYAGVFADFTQSALLAQRSAMASGCRAALTVCVHDIYAQRLLRSRRTHEVLLTGLIIRDEQALLSSANQVQTLSSKDAHLARALYALPDVVVKPFEAPDWCARVSRLPEHIDADLLLFFANFERAENREAAQWFIRTALPNIRTARPAVKLTLAGTGSDSLAAQLNMAGVSGTGFLDDPSPYFARCALMIAPLLRGAGVKFKVLEALAARVPVVGTPVALEGVEPEPRLMSSPPESIADAVLIGLNRFSPSP